jgi:uncharacterized membrane protein
MKQHDILVNTKAGLEWVCGIFTDTVEDAIKCAIQQSKRGAKYVGHKSYSVINGAWVECA